MQDDGHSAFYINKMEKRSGGTRNYSHRTKTLAKRRAEFDKVVSTHLYREEYFDKSGGYYVIHEGHNKINDAVNKEVLGAKALAEHGYRAYLMSEKNYIYGFKKNDGFVDHATVDFKTVSTPGKYTVERALKDASLQNAELCVVIQNSKDVTREYIENQWESYKMHAKGNEARIKALWVVSLDGQRIHRHT